MADTANRTQPTAADAAAFLAAVDGDERRRDCETLAAMMRRVTGRPPVMWGPAMVGFDTYHYRYASGREGDWFVVGFSPRRGGLSIYLTCAGDRQDALLARLGKHSMGKSCLTVKRLADVDLAVLEDLVRHSVAEVKRAFP